MYLVLDDLFGQLDDLRAKYRSGLISKQEVVEGIQRIGKVAGAALTLDELDPETREQLIKTIG